MVNDPGRWPGLVDSGIFDAKIGKTPEAADAAVPLSGAFLYAPKAADVAVPLSMAFFYAPKAG